MRIRCHNLERAAEMHYFIRPQIERGLKNFQIAEDSRHVALGCDTYWDFFQRRCGDRFLDMTTMIRMGTGIETHLRDLFMRRKGYSHLSELDSDPRVTAAGRGCFQRLGANAPKGAVAIMQGVGIDLTSTTEFGAAQELMLHRHLYAHTSGVIDGKYVEYWRNLTGENILQLSGYERALESDTYWFAPLDRIPEYIERLRKFVGALG